MLSGRNGTKIECGGTTGHLTGLNVFFYALQTTDPLGVCQMNKGIDSDN